MQSNNNVDVSMKQENNATATNIIGFKTFGTRPVISRDEVSQLCQLQYSTGTYFVNTERMKGRVDLSWKCMKCL